MRAARIRLCERWPERLTSEFLGSTIWISTITVIVEFSQMLSQFTIINRYVYFFIPLMRCAIFLNRLRVFSNFAAVRCAIVLSATSVLFEWQRANSLHINWFSLGYSQFAKDANTFILLSHFYESLVKGLRSMQLCNLSRNIH